MSSINRVLVYGGSGALGDALVKHFSNNNNFWVVSVDLKENSSASENILVNPNESLSEQENRINKTLDNLLAENNKLDAILNVAGGWAGGNAASAQFLANSELMWKQSVNSSLIAASLASKHLKEGGLLTLPGAASALDATPSMIGYGLAKAAVHHLTKTLAANKSGLPSNSNVASILPITLDTPMNRKWMSDADFSTWTPLSFIVELFDKWINNSNERAPNGSLVKLTTTNSQTSLSFH